MKKYEFTGKSVEEAIKEGLKQLNKRQDEVDIKIISNGGLFKKAKVELSFEEEELNVENIAKNLEQEITKAGGKVYENSYIKMTSTTVTSDGETIKVKTESVEKVNDEPAVESEEEQTFDAVTLQEKDDDEQKLDYLKEFLQGLTDLMGVKANILITQDDEKITALLKNENASQLVGYHGECLNAIQHIANNVMQKKFHKVKRIFVNIENYRENREETLKHIADKLVKKVMVTGRPQKLNPMNSYERRIIHTYLQDNINVYTESSGVEPRRYLVIYPNGYEGSKK